MPIGTDNLSRRTGRTSPASSTTAAGGAVKKPVDMKAVRRKRAFNEAEFTRSKAKFAKTHSGTMKRMHAQAAPGAAPLEERGAGAGQGAAALGRYVGQQRAAYEKSVPFIYGLAKMKNARNAELAEITARTRAAQDSVSPSGGANRLTGEDFAEMGMPDRNAPNMGRQPESLSAEESAAMNESPANTLAKAGLSAPTAACFITSYKTPSPISRCHRFPLAIQIPL